MARRITSRVGLFGDTRFFEGGKLIGKSRPTLFGTTGF